MPYQEQSPLAAAVGMAGGWLKGQQEAKQRALEQQQLQQEMGLRQAQLALEQKRDAANEAYQNFDMDDRRTASQLHQGVDPKTGKPIMSELPSNLTQIRPGNKGKGGPVTSQEQYEHAMKVGTFLMSRGFKDQAAPYFDTADTIAAQIGRDDMFKNDFAKAIVLANYTTTRQLQVEQARGGVDAANEDRRFGHETQLKGMPTYADLHPKPGASRGANIPTFNSVNSMLNEWSNGSQAQIGKDIATGTPQFGRVPPTSAAKNYMYAAVTQIQQSRSPLAAASLAVMAYKKHFPGDAQGVRVLQEAGQQAALPPPPPTP